MLYVKQNPDSDAMQMAEKTLLQMRKGGIFDHIGGGFSRYSTDKYFLAPHFEKMLYDNALLIMAYSAAYSMTKNPVYLDTAKETADYVLREMTSPDGGFYSAQDADSDGVEGKFYTFALEEIPEVLGDGGQRFAKVFDITAGGNFEDVNIPNLLKSSDLQSDFSDEKRKLYDYRRERTSLHLDDKILLSWNSMMIAAMAMLYRISHEGQYLKVAQKAQTIIENNLCDGVQLYTSFRDGKRSDKAFLDDCAYYISALIELYNSTLNRGYLEKAEQFCIETVKRFTDNENGGFFLCETGNSELFMNPKETYDGAIPSGNSVMAYNFVRLYQLTEDEKYRKLANRQLTFLSAQAADYPAGHSLFLLAKLLFEIPPERVTIVLKDESDFSEILKRQPFLANVSVVQESEKYHLLNLIMNENRFYICEHCGNIVGMIHDAGKSLRCCGEKMKQLAPSADASAEKHTPIVKVEGNTVKVNVGSISHPMTEEHSITWVYLQTDRGGQRKCLKQGGEPIVTFALLDEKPVAVYAYCNLHGMWKTEL